MKEEGVREGTRQEGGLIGRTLMGVPSSTAGGTRFNAAINSSF